MKENLTVLTLALPDVLSHGPASPQAHDWQVAAWKAAHGEENTGSEGGRKKEKCRARAWAGRKRTEAIFHFYPVCLTAVSGHRWHFTNLLTHEGIRISMDGRGRALDNVFVERLWRTVKYEEVYLKDYTTVREARQGLGQYFTFYNHERLHQALGYQTPAAVYYWKRGTK
jgi:hypothetical protein